MILYGFYFLKKFDKRTFILFSFIFIMVMLETGCTPSRNLQPENVSNASNNQRNIVSNNLPIEFQWSKSMPNGRPRGNQPLVCYGDKGAIIQWLPYESEWKNLAVFDHSGELLWSQKSEQSNVLTMNDSVVSVFTHDTLQTYDLLSGNLLWETDAGLGAKLSAYLFPDEGALRFVSNHGYDLFDSESGNLISRKDVTSDDLVIQNDDINFHSSKNDARLYATSIDDPNSKLWESNVLIYGYFQPQFYNDGIIVQSGLLGQNVCQVNINDGSTNWCEDKRLNSNIAVHNGIGYGINNNGELVGFDVESGGEIGKVVFQPMGDRDTGFRNYVAACTEHLLIYTTSPEELMWFDFLSE